MMEFKIWELLIQKDIHAGNAWVIWFFGWITLALLCFGFKNSSSKHQKIWFGLMTNILLLWGFEIFINPPIDAGMAYQMEQQWVENRIKQEQPINETDKNGELMSHTALWQERVLKDDFKNEYLKYAKEEHVSVKQVLDEVAPRFQECLQWDKQNHPSWKSVSFNSHIPHVNQKNPMDILQDLEPRFEEWKRQCQEESLNSLLDERRNQASKNIDIK